MADAAPEFRIPARVSFISAEAQFTPKEVETRTEREKLMFRVKVKIDPQLLDGQKQVGAAARLLLIELLGIEPLGRLYHTNAGLTRLVEGEGGAFVARPAGSGPARAGDA